MKPEENPTPTNSDVNNSDVNNSDVNNSEANTVGPDSSSQSIAPSAGVADTADRTAEVVTEVVVIDEAIESNDVIMASVATIQPATPPPLAPSMENLAANGGAVGAVVLGCWCLIGAFVTNWSIINGVIGLVMGVWGLTSRKSKMAWIGILICAVGILLCLVQVGEIINSLLNARTEDSL